MYSSLDEVWNDDPMKIITNKITSGKYYQKPDISEKKLTQECILDASTTISDEYYPLTELYNSVNITENIKDKDVARYKFAERENNYVEKEQPVERAKIIEGFVESPCFTSLKHLKKCKNCQNKFKKYINMDMDTPTWLSGQGVKDTYLLFLLVILIIFMFFIMIILIKK